MAGLGGVEGLAGHGEGLLVRRVLVEEVEDGVEELLVEGVGHGWGR